MIQVTYYPEENRLTIRGHAESGTYGYDLVCAAASILALTLRANVEHLAEQGLLTQAVTVLEEGNGEIRCRSAAGQEQILRQRFAAICEGYALLAKQYPAYVSYRAASNQECRGDHCVRP